MGKPLAIHFEAKLFALRKSKDGLVLSFVVHPSDIPKEIITADIGEQYIVACAPYVDTAGPVREAEVSPLGTAVTPATEGQAVAGKEKTEGIPYKATLVFDDRTDVVHGVIPVNGIPKPAKTDAQWAVQRAGMLCDDLKFQLWISGRPMADTCKTAVEYVRKYCGVTSRKEFLTNPVACGKFITLETSYRMETGGMAEQRG